MWQHKPLFDLGQSHDFQSNIMFDLRLRGITIIDLMTSANTGNVAIDALIEAFQQWQDEQALDEISQNAKRGLAQLVGTRDNDPEFLKYNPEWKSTGAYLGVMPGGVPTGFKGERIQVGIYNRKKGHTAGEPRIVQRIIPDPDMWDRCYLAWEMRHSGALAQSTRQHAYSRTSMATTASSQTPFTLAIWNTGVSSTRILYPP
jgi:hypothetical protein